MSNKKNCVNIPGAICNVKRTVDAFGRRRLDGLKRISVSLKNNTMDELESKCRTACQESDTCYGSFGMSSSNNAKKCYHCTTPKNPLRYTKVRNLQVCDDGTNPRNNYHDATIDYDNLTSGFKIIKPEVREYNQVKLISQLEGLESELNTVEKVKQEYIMNYNNLKVEFETIETELDTLCQIKGSKQELTTYFFFRRSK